MALTVAVGFSGTYFAPLLAGEVRGRMSPAVHLHGWSFFIWYLLLPLQAGLVRVRRLRWHRRLGSASVALAAVMVATGVVVVSVRVRDAVAEGGPSFWSGFGLPVLSTLVLFTLFYGLALRYRRSPALHRRLIMVASAAGLGAAVFRIVAQSPLGGPWSAPAGILLTNLFIVAGMIRDRVREGRVHPVWWAGLGVCLAVEALAIALPHTPAGPVLNGGLAAMGRALGGLY